MKRLDELAEIRTGYPFRGRIERVECGGCRLVQMGDVRADRAEVTDNLVRVEAPSNWQRHILNHGDVLFVGRGVRNEAATFVAEAMDVIAAPHLFVLRVRADDVRFSAYLTWFLNLPETQALIRTFRSGSAVPFVPRDAFARLEVPLPSPEMRNRIDIINQLRQREQRLLDEISERRRRLIDGLMREAIRRESEATRPPAVDGVSTGHGNEQILFKTT